MVGYDKGVPQSVIYAASTVASDRTFQLLSGMIVDLAGAVHGWDEQTIKDQQNLSMSMLQLIAADSLRDILKSQKDEPKEEGTDEGKT